MHQSSSLNKLTSFLSPDPSASRLYTFTSGQILTTAGGDAPPISSCAAAGGAGDIKCDLSREQFDALHMMHGVLARLDELSDSVACGLCRQVINDLEASTRDRSIVDVKGSGANYTPVDSATDLTYSLSELYWHLMDEINGLHWRDVPRATRDAFSGVSVLVCKTALSSWRGDEVALKEMFKVCDVALLLGSDFAYPELQSLLETLDRLLASHQDSSPTGLLLSHRSWRRPISTMGYLPAILKPLQRHLGRVLELPGPVSIAAFRDDFMRHGLPVKFLCGTFEHWPARMPGERAWNNLQYIHRVAGHRTVPVELGNYLSDDSSQAIMTMDEFMAAFLVDDGGNRPADGTDEEGPPVKQPRRATPSYGCASSAAVGYLAQHRLLHQIPVLRRDVCVPDYCSILLPEDLAGQTEAAADAEGRTKLDNDDGGAQEEQEDEEDDVLVNAWLGPVGTVSPLHHDPYHNLLAQVYGYKYVRLFAAAQSEKLYACSGRMSNNSPVDVLSLDVSRYPDAVHAEFLDTVLCPGEVLYIPRHYWHFVASIDGETAASILGSSPSSPRADGHGIVASHCGPITSETELEGEAPRRGLDGGSRVASGGGGQEDMPCWSVSFWWGRRILKSLG